jgi:predicted DCC family thiol-disulfide oxidoreductase YuxK
MEELPKDKKIILFDGVCNLCDATVQYVIKKDVNDAFRFVAIQSELGQKIIDYIKVDTSQTDSIILYIPGKAYYVKADAAFNIAKDLGGLISLTNYLTILPNFLKNFGYDFVAKNRYKWYGKKDSCMMPTPELKSKFL